MKKQFIFTKESTFTHLKDKMYHGETEHILQDDLTKKLYHHIVGYGSEVAISSESTFIAHLLEKIGVTGFSKSYVASDCKIDLPWYPSKYSITAKAVVELPEKAELKDFEFGEKEGELSERYKQTFVGKTFEIKQGDKTYILSGKKVLKILFGATTVELGHFQKRELVYPFQTILASEKVFGEQEKAQFIHLLGKLDVNDHQEIVSVLKKFAKIDLKKEVESFEKEVKTKIQPLFKDLSLRQEIVKKHLLTKQQETKTDKEF